MLFWRPLDPVKDNADATGAYPPNWNEDDSTWDFKPVLEFTAKEWAYDDKPPFSWFVTVRPATTLLSGYAGEWANVFTTLIVFVAPHVKVERLPRPFYRVASSYANPDIRIIRVDSIYEVPRPGSEPNLGLLLGERPTLEYLNGRLAPGEYLDEVNANTLPDGPTSFSLPDVRIVREDLRLTIEKKTRFRLKINLHETDPSFFKVGVFPDFIKPTRNIRVPGLETNENALGVRSQDVVFKVIYGGAASVEFSSDALNMGDQYYIGAKLETRKVAHRPETEKRPATALWLNDGVESLSKKESIIKKDRFAEPEYYDFRSGTWNEFDADPDWHGIDTLFQMGIGFIPVVGQLYDVADILSVALTGKDIWGAKKSKSDIILMGGFAIFGVLGDLSKHVDIAQMTRIGEYLFPGYKVVSKNPNFARFLVRAAFAGTPSFTHAGEVLAKKHGDEFMREMDRLIQAGDEAGLAALAKRFESEFEAVMRANAESIQFSKHPATVAILRNSSGELGHVLRNIDESDVPKPVLDRIINTWDEAHGKMELDNLLDDIEGISKVAHAKLLDALQQKIVDDVSNDPAVIRRAAAYLARYGDAKYIEKHGEAFSPFGYLVNVAGKSTEARDAFDLKYGKKAWPILTGRKPPPDPEAMIKRYGKEIDSFLNDIDTYHNHREVISEYFPGLGIVLNSDHILESRFRKSEYFEGSVDSSLFRAILVPANLVVAKAMRASGHDIGWYIHTQKTARMNQLLPQKNDFYTAEEIGDAYQLFWIHEMGMDKTFFQNLFEEELQFLHMAQNGHHVIDGIDNPLEGKIVFTAFKERDELIKTVYGRIGKMKLHWFEDAKIGNRVSDAPGLD
ncbi:MAG: hypothetical protein ABJP82_20630, partial [Hyphomicrobiales bacterium]